MVFEYYNRYMIFKKKYIFIGLASIGLLALFIPVLSRAPEMTSWRVEERELEQIAIGEGVFSVVLSDTEQERRQGLSGWTSLDEGLGMLFVFEEPAKLSFWMKDMYFAIDMIWIDEEGEIVHIEHDVQPETYPQTFTSEDDALYVLELVSGEAEKRGISVGEQVVFYDR